MALPFPYSAVVTFLVVACGVYVGVLRALDVYFGGHDSYFLPDRDDPASFLRVSSDESSPEDRDADDSS